MEAIIEPGSTQGETIWLEGFADEYPGMKPGDIVMVITEKDEGEDQVYERRGNELIMAMNVSLSEVSKLKFFVKNGDRFSFLGSKISKL